MVATEAAVRRSLAETLPVDPIEVSCPASIPVGEGLRVRCTVTLADTAGDLRVEVAQGAEAGDLEVVPLDAVLIRAEVAATLKAELKDRFERSFMADCGGEGAVVAQPGRSEDPSGEPFTCTARDATSRRQVIVTATDAAGTLEFEVQDP